MAREHVVKMDVEVAKAIIPGLLMTGAFSECSWVVGQHHADPAYEVGCYVTEDRFGDYTTHPNYMGVNQDDRHDDDSVVDWVTSNLPKSGVVEIRIAVRGVEINTPMTYIAEVMRQISAKTDEAHGELHALIIEALGAKYSEVGTTPEQGKLIKRINHAHSAVAQTSRTVHSNPPLTEALRHAFQVQVGCVEFDEFGCAQVRIRTSVLCGDVESCEDFTSAEFQVKRNLIQALDSNPGYEAWRRSELVYVIL